MTGLYVGTNGGVEKGFGGFWEGLRRDWWRWRWRWGSAAMNLRRRDLASVNLLKLKREERRVRREGRELEGREKVGMWVWDHWKNERRVIGRVERDLEEKMERIIGGVRWGMKGFRFLR